MRIKVIVLLLLLFYAACSDTRDQSSTNELPTCNGEVSGTVQQRQQEVVLEVAISAQEEFTFSEVKDLEFNPEAYSGSGKIEQNVFSGTYVLDTDEIPSVVNVRYRAIEKRTSVSMNTLRECRGSGIILREF